MYSGIHRAEVVSRDDPEKRGRLSVKLPVILRNPDGSSEPVWVEPCWSSFNRDLPAPGTIVLVAFEYPCTVLTNGFWLGMIDYMPNGFSETPIQAQQNPETDFPGGRGIGTAAFGDLTGMGTSNETDVLSANTIDEPASFQDTTYGQDHVRKTPGGMVEEWDDGAGSFENHRYNRMVGNNQVEVLGDGSEYRRATVRMEFLLGERRVVDGDREQIVGGHERTLTEGSRVFEIDGALIGETGPVRVRLSSLDVAIDRDDENGTRMTSGGGLTVEAIGNMMMAAGEITMVSGGQLILGSSLSSSDVRGLSSASLSSTGVTAIHGSQVVVGPDTLSIGGNQAAANVVAGAGFSPLIMNTAQYAALTAFLAAHTHNVLGSVTGPPLPTLPPGAVGTPSTILKVAS